MSKEQGPVLAYNEVRLAAKELYTYLRKHQKIKCVPHVYRSNKQTEEKASREIGRTPSSREMSLWSRSTAQEIENGYFRMQCAVSPTDEHAHYLRNKFRGHNWARSVKIHDLAYGTITRNYDTSTKTIPIVTSIALAIGNFVPQSVVELVVDYSVYVRWTFFLSLLVLIIVLPHTIKSCYQLFESRREHNAIGNILNCAMLLDENQNKGIRK